MKKNLFILFVCGLLGLLLSEAAYAKNKSFGTVTVSYTELTNSGWVKGVMGPAAFVNNPQPLR